MLKLISLFIAFGFGATFGYYVPLGTLGVNSSFVKIPMPNLNAQSLPSKDTGYRRTDIAGIIQSIDHTTETMTLLYYPEYALRDNRLISFHFDTGIKISNRKTVKKNDIITFWEFLPTTSSMSSLKPGDTANVTFKHDEITKTLLAVEISGL